MKIAIIGNGNVGRAIATNLRGKGHEIRFGLRNPVALGEGEFKSDHIVDAAQWSEVIFMAVPFAALEEVSQHIAHLAGKIIIDATNPLARGTNGLGLSLGHDNSGAEQLQEWLPDLAIVKALNQCGAETIANPSCMQTKPAMFIAGDDTKAKSVVFPLIQDMGFETMDAGNLSAARFLEPFALTWINQAIAKGEGRDWAFSITRTKDKS